ncbi:MAG: hypothetical protein AB1505_03295 [Candidatus Latescibacterota bacterium]
MRTSLSLLGAAVASVLLGPGCGEEPDRIVQSQTADGAFALTLEAQSRWARPGERVPILVTLESLRGPVPADLEEGIELVADSGTVFPTLVVATLAGPDSTGAGAQSRYAEWVVFTASATADSRARGEVHALFRDIEATVRIRITPADAGS